MSCISLYQQTTSIDNECEKFLVVKTDLSLCIINLISDLCKKASRKIPALIRVTPLMTFGKRKLLMNDFKISQFSY